MSKATMNNPKEGLSQFQHIVEAEEGLDRIGALVRSLELLSQVEHDEGLDSDELAAWRLADYARAEIEKAKEHLDIASKAGKEA